MISAKYMNINIMRKKGERMKWDIATFPVLRTLREQQTLHINQTTKVLTQKGRRRQCSSARDDDTTQHDIEGESMSQKR